MTRIAQIAQVTDDPNAPYHESALAHLVEMTGRGRMAEVVRQARGSGAGKRLRKAAE